ncbi:unnamed protein product [Mytilus edulis]|uniref:Uncharacterized protein n=1 Tax=Mytilus edulis TaxID=6550 RepID=A0A8S3UXW3_MYTED|nr:unnamed protein product [Mytilus edulis]
MAVIVSCSPGQPMTLIVSGSPGQTMAVIVSVSPGQTMTLIVSGSPGQTMAVIVSVSPGQTMALIVSGSSSQTITVIVSCSPGQPMALIYCQWQSWSVVSGSPGQTILSLSMAVLVKLSQSLSVLWSNYRSAIDLTICTVCMYNRLFDKHQ